MLGTIAGLFAGIALLGGWWSLFGFSAVMAIGIGSWRMSSAYRRLLRGRGHVQAAQDAYNITLTGSASDPDEAATRILDGGRVPRPPFLSYCRASAWEFITIAVTASVARLLKIFLFAG